MTVSECNRHGAHPAPHRNRGDWNPSPSASPATPATACSWPARSSPTPRPSSATTSARCPTSPPRSAPRPARWPASPASRSSSAAHDIHTPGDQPRHPGRHEPRRPQDQPQGPRAGRHPDRQHRRLQHRRPAQGRLQDQPAGGRLAQGLPPLPRSRSPRSTARPSPTSSSARARPTAARTSSPWAWSTGCTSARWSRRCAGSSDKFAKNPAVLEANTPRPQGRLQLRRDHRGAAGPLPRAPRRTITPGTLSQDHRQRGPGPGPGRRRHSWPTCRWSTPATRSRRPATSCTTWPS